MFVDPDHAGTTEYTAFWRALASGEFQSGEYRRIGKGGKEIWLQATYNPIMGRNGKPVRVIKFAADITEKKSQSADHAAKIEAISRAQAVIEFELDGTILTANENFLATLGYRLDEIQGRHHRMFVDPAFAGSADYEQFWHRLRSGEFVAAAALVEETNAAIEQTEAQASELDRIVDVFSFGAEEAAAPAPAKPARRDVRQAARAYLTQGNAALKEEWSQF